MARRGHGGSCCGINHSVGYSFGGNAERIRREIRGDKIGLANGMLLEVVVTDPQLISQPCLGPILAEEGFQLVTRFKNPNSPNIVNVFHYTAARRSMDDLPFSLDPEQAPKPADPVPVQDEAGRWRRLQRFEAFNNRSVLRVNKRGLITHGMTLRPGTYWLEAQYVHHGSVVYRKDSLEIQVR